MDFRHPTTCSNKGRYLYLMYKPIKSMLFVVFISKLWRNIKWMQVKNKRIQKIIVNLMGILVKNILTTAHKLKALELYLVRKKNNLTNPDVSNSDCMIKRLSNLEGVC